MPIKPPRISDGLRAKFHAIATEAAGLVPPDAFANYVIIDPTQPDPEGILPGIAIYTGQSGNVRGRIRSHLRHAVIPGSDQGRLYDRMAELIRAGTMPIFRILETHRNRAESLMAETVWAQRLLRSGAKLLNTWPEQSRLITGSSARRMQRVRLMFLSLTDAQSAGLSLRISCANGCYSMVASPADLALWFGDRITLQGVRKRSTRCPLCEGRNRFEVASASDPESDELDGEVHPPAMMPTAEFESRLFGR